MNSYGSDNALLNNKERSVALEACNDSGFTESAAIVQAMRTNNLQEIANLLKTALEEWRGDQGGSPDYPAKSVCIHELIPPTLPEPDENNLVPQFHAIGIEYIQMPHGYSLTGNPVDENIEELTEQYPDTRWGQVAFWMRIKSGWALGACGGSEGHKSPLIGQVEAFLSRNSHSEVAPDVSLELARMYTTWWNLSRHPAVRDINPKFYKPGAEKARQKAIQLYESVQSHAALPKESLRTLAALKTKSSSGTYDYYCVEDKE